MADVPFMDTPVQTTVEVYSAAIPVGLVRAFVIQNNRRFDFDQYGITVSRIR